MQFPLRVGAHGAAPASAIAVLDAPTPGPGILPRRTPLASDPLDFPLADGNAESSASFDAVFVAHQTAIYNYVLRMIGNPDDAYDLTLTAFEKALRAYGRMPADLDVKAWLYRIATNTCLDELRRRKVVRWQPLDTFLSVFHPKQISPDSPEREVIRAEENSLLRKALARIPERYRAALLLRETQDLSCEEIGAAMGISRGAAKVLLFRAREQLRREYLAIGGEAPEVRE